ncbi:MAG: TlpA family protein disulfide reductase [Chitinophagaceae bacterium]|nr:TlpA family protein disulfide reductase [Chitinophagaceae bacterium]
MKPLITLLFLVFLSVGVRAQKIDPETLEVKDSTGKQYAVEVWQKLVFSGRYSLQINNDMKTALLVKLSEEEATRRLLKAPKPRESIFFTTGESIAPFAEKDINGTQFDLKALTGKVVVLNFWFINCGPCRMEIPELNEIAEAYKDNKDVVFLAVALDQRYEIQDFLKKIPFSYNIIGNGGSIAGKYGVNSYPTHAVVNRQGKILFHTTGYAMNTVAWVKRSIQAALENKPLE